LQDQGIVMLVTATCGELDGCALVGKQDFELSANRVPTFA
jgi:hypothetical protein